MRIATTLIGTDTPRFRELDANDERGKLLDLIARETRGKADVVLLPAGVWTIAASSPSCIEEGAEKVASKFRHCAVFGGVDLERKQLDKVTHAIVGFRGKQRHEPTAHAGKRRDRAPSGPGLGFWGFAAVKGKAAGWWQQRAVYPGDPVQDPSPRVVSVAGHRIGVLLCGEIYNPDVRAALGEEELGVVVDLGHRGMGRKFHDTLPNTATAVGCDVYLAQHRGLQARDGGHWMSTAKAARQRFKPDWASYDDDERRGALWAEVKYWPAI